MRRQFLALLSGALVLALSVGVGLSVAAGTAAGGKGKADAELGHAHNLDGPLSAEMRERRAKAHEMLLKGKIKQGDKVAQIGRGRYVEFTRDDTDKVFVVIADFGNTRHSAFQDDCGYCTAQTFDGPAHNAIPQPDRRVDNTTLWKSDYNKAHYEDMYFNRMAEYFETQSSGRYSVEGQVTEWVRVPFNEARYGRSGDTGGVDPAVCSGIVCNNTWFLIRDAMAFWVQGQLDAGKSMAEIQAYLRTFDEWDRYDLNEDGNFDQPDGFIDHFQIVHAGGDEAAGDPFQGNDAIWSHRWYASIYGGGPGGLPGVNIGRATFVGPAGGVFDDHSVPLPNNPTGVWVGDYTIQPENGGLGVFAHEYAHDLGLPDLYDTSGNTGGAENSTGFWTLMSSGANIGDGGREGIGDDPTDLGVWEKFQLGWLDYDVAVAGARSEHKLGPAEGTTRNGKQGLFVVLPDKELPLNLGNPCSTCGSRYFYSGAGDDLNVTMSKTGITGTALTAKVRYDIEPEWDYAFLEASPNGTAWTPVPTNRSDLPGHAGAHNESGFNTSGAGITGASSSADANWVDLTATLPAGTTAIRFRYQTDAAVVEPGFQVDNIAVGGTLVGTAETDTEGWVFDGFRTTTGQETQFFFNAYVAENRGYRSYDTSLKTAYNFGFLNTRPDWVESFSYQDGLLISYWDSSHTDNNVGDHPGEGLLLPVDAHPTFHHAANGDLLRPRILSFDSTFSKQNTKAITVNINSQPTTIPAQAGVDTFDDTKDYWFNEDQHAATGAHQGRYQPGWNSVKVPKTGTTVSIKSGGPQSATLDVVVAPK